MKRELNVPEIVVNQAIGINVVKELERNLVSLDPLKTSVTAELVVYTTFCNAFGLSLWK